MKLQMFVASTRGTTKDNRECLRLQMLMGEYQSAEENRGSQACGTLPQNPCWERPWSKLSLKL